MNTTDFLIVKIRQVNTQQVDNDKTMCNFYQAAGHHNHYMQTTTWYLHSADPSGYLSAPPPTSIRFTITSNVEILDINS